MDAHCGSCVSHGVKKNVCAFQSMSSLASLRTCRADEAGCMRKISGNRYG